MSANARRCLTIVLAAGEGVRMRSARPKVLHELAGRSMLAHTVSTVLDGATGDVVVVVGPDRDSVAAEALKVARMAERNAAENANQAVLGRYMVDMKHSVNNALTSMLGNAELLLLEPGQLSSQSLAQIKTIHSMAMRINEIMQRFSSLSSEMREAENASQAETEAEPASPGSHR